MKFEWVVDFKVNEVELRLVLDMLIGVTALLGGIFYDYIAGKLLIQHSIGMGLHQFGWIAFWGLYVTWTSMQFKAWKE